MTNPTNYDFTNGNYPEPTVGPAFNNRNNALPDAGSTFCFIPTTTSLSCEAGAYLRDGSYGNPGYGSDTLLQLKNDPGAGYSRIAYLKFIVPPQARDHINNVRQILCADFADQLMTATGYQRHLRIQTQDHLFIREYFSNNKDKIREICGNPTQTIPDTR